LKVKYNIIDWNEYKNKILTNLLNNIFDIYNGNKLYKKGKLREILHESIVLNNKIFKEVGYNNYEPRDNYNLSFYDICVNIITKKTITNYIYSLVTLKIK